MITNLLLTPSLLAFFISLLVTPLVISLMWKLKVVDDPAKHHHPKVIHTRPTPRGGGLALFVSFLISSLIFLPLDKHLVGIIIGATILVAMGLLDDKYNLSPYKRFAVQIIAAAAPIIAGIGISYITNPFFGGTIDLSQPQISFYLLGKARSIWILSDLFALFWIVALINFLNMGAKGVPGQLSGVTAISAFTIAILSLRFSADITEWPVTILAAITAGAFLGFLPWHTFPQKIMPSFGGSNLAGYLLAVLSILSTAKVGTLMLILAVPIIDTGYTVVRRVMSGKSPVWGDRGHLHHKLIDKWGFSQLQVAIFYWGATALFGLLALNLNAESKLYTIIGTAIGLGGLLLFLTYKSKWKN